MATPGPIALSMSDDQNQTHRRVSLTGRTRCLQASLTEARRRQRELTASESPIELHKHTDRRLDVD